MPISENCNREVIIVQRDDTALDAAKLMRQHRVGDVLVVEDRNGKRIPVGIVTDRDLVFEIMASELDANAITVGDIMLPALATVYVRSHPEQACQGRAALAGIGRKWRGGWNHNHG